MWPKKSLLRTDTSGCTEDLATWDSCVPLAVLSPSVRGSIYSLWSHAEETWTVQKHENNCKWMKTGHPRAATIRNPESFWKAAHFIPTSHSVVFRWCLLKYLSTRQELYFIVQESVLLKTWTAFAKFPGSFRESTFIKRIQQDHSSTTHANIRHD